MSANRMLYLSFAALLFAGIALSGFAEVHWLLYLPLGFATFAGLTGYCLNLMLWRRLGFEDEASCRVAERTRNDT